MLPFRIRIHLIFSRSWPEGSSPDRPVRRSFRMDILDGLPSRRGFLGTLGLGLGSVAFFTVPGAFADELARTPGIEEGPFYPPRLPLDTDNDLIIINNSITPAVGQITHL